MALVTVLVEVERVKMVVVCQSAGTVVHLESLQRGLTIQKCCVDCLPDSMEGRLTVFAGLKVNIICLEVPGCWSSTTTKDAGCADTDAGIGGCCTLAITVAGCVVAI